MITPSYSATATERVLPRLALDFTTAALDSRVTVTRALNTATRINSSGYIEAVNADLPRFDFTTGTSPTCRGLLIEEARINVIRFSNDFTNVLWAKTNASPTAGAASSPDGTVNATKLVESAAAGVHSFLGEFTPTAGTAYTASIFVKAAERSWCALELGGPPLACFAYVNLSTGAIGTTSGSPTSVIVTPYKDSWWRVSITKTASAAAGAGTLTIYSATGNNGASYTGDGTSGILIYGGQVEAGAFATSYIPNAAGGTTTRNADLVDMTGTNFSSWYNATEGTIYAEYIPFTTNLAQRGVFSINDGTSNNTADWRPNGGNFTVTSGGASQADMYPGGVAVDTIGKGVLALKLNSMACARNGNTVLTDNTALMPVAPNQLNIGRINIGPTTSICGWMRKIMYWPQRVTDAEVRAFSK